MKTFIAKPVVIEATRIEKIGNKDSHGQIEIGLEGGETIIVSASLNPTHGDYRVTRQDGTISIETRKSFEDRYQPIGRIVRESIDGVELGKFELDPEVEIAEEKTE